MHDLDQTIDHLVGEYSSRQISRRDFFRRAAQVGVGASGAATILSAIAASPALAADAGAAAVKGGILREGYNRDVSPLDPVGTTWWDAGLFPVTQETLVTADASGKFIPLLAQSWETSAERTRRRSPSTVSIATTRTPPRSAECACSRAEWWRAEFASLP